MSVIESIFLGLIQGLTEFLPISSSGHLVLFQNILNIGTNSADLLFDSILHLGTLFAVFLAFWQQIKTIIKELAVSLKQILTGKFHYRNINSNRKLIFSLFISLTPLLIIFPFKDFIEKTYSSVLTVGIALLVTSILLFFCDNVVEGKISEKDLTIKKALIIGVVQTFAIIPGLSRSGSTITAGIMCGFNRTFAVQYSFLLSIPTILAGSLLNLFEALNEGAFDNSLLIPYILGMVAAAISGYASLKLLQYLLKTKKFIIFSIYCLAVGLFSIFYSMA